MASPAEKFFTGLFDEKDFANLTKKTSVSMTISVTAWLGNFFFPGKTGEFCGLKSTSLAIAVIMGCVSIFFALKREKPLRKKTVLAAIEDNDFVQRSGIVTGLNAEKSAKYLEDCLKQEIQP
jgi:hypothetical protein